LNEIAPPRQLNRWAASLNLMRLILTSILAVVSVATFGQTPRNNRCEPPEEICMGVGCEKRVPVIFGTHYEVPTLRVKLIDKNTNKPASVASITFNYNWKWLEYPYTEHPFGVWSEENYSTTCSADEGGIVEVGQFKVEPHGWYKGIYSVGKKPRFTGVTVGYDLPYVGSTEKHCHTYTEISRSQLEKCRRNGRCEFTIKDGCPSDWR
jgi:hypothetical protein